MARVISFLNCKGGVGKTSLAVNVAAALAHDLKQHVLLVDMDSQSNASIWLMGIEHWQHLDGQLQKTTCCFFKGLGFLSEAIHKSVYYRPDTGRALPSLDLIPAFYDLLDLDHEYKQTGAEPYYLIFYNQISPLHAYDYIIFDCPPALGRATKCAVFSSPEIYIPCDPSSLSALGIKLLGNRLSLFLNTESKPYQKQAPGWKHPLLRGAILNAVPNAKKFVQAERSLITQRIQYERKNKPNMFDPNALLLQHEIRFAVVAAKNADSPSLTGIAGITAVLARDDYPELAEDYSKLATYIHEHPIKL